MRASEEARDEEWRFSSSPSSVAATITSIRLTLAERFGGKIQFARNQEWSRGLLFISTDTQARYVWHCHILQHDNEMMRPFEVSYRTEMSTRPRRTLLRDLSGKRFV